MTSSFILHLEHRPGTPGCFRKAFSLPEVMFAVMILGIGFIMVAAMFPVAIQQAKDTREETTAAEVTKSAVSIIEQQHSTAAALTATATGLVDKTNSWAFWSNATFGISSSVIYTPDPRFAWTALYRRTTGDPYAQVYIFALSSADGRSFDLTTDATGLQPNLWPRRVEIEQNGAATDQIVLRDDTGAGPYPAAHDAVADNTFLLTEGGLIFRVTSPQGTDAGGNYIWQLYPGQDASTLPAGWTKTWLVGRRWNGTAYEGLTQDISLYTTYVRVRN